MKKETIDRITKVREDLRTLMEEDLQSVIDEGQAEFDGMTQGQQDSQQGGELEAVIDALASAFDELQTGADSLDELLRDAA